MKIFQRKKRLLQRGNQRKEKRRVMRRRKFRRRKLHRKGKERKGKRKAVMITGKAHMKMMQNLKLQ